MARTSRTATPIVEQCWIVVGQRRGSIWYGRRVRHCRGQAVTVRFDGLWVLQREERHQDVLGFFHTHPGGAPSPSPRDIKTMRAWCSAFGKPLLCIISSPEGVKGYRFEDNAPKGSELDRLEVFPRGVVIGVDADGEQVSS